MAMDGKGSRNYSQGTGRMSNKYNIGMNKKVIPSLRRGNLAPAGRRVPIRPKNNWGRY